MLKILPESKTNSGKSFRNGFARNFYYWTLKLTCPVYRWLTWCGDCTARGCCGRGCCRGAPEYPAIFFVFCYKLALVLTVFFLLFDFIFRFLWTFLNTITPSKRWNKKTKLKTMHNIIQVQNVGGRCFNNYFAIFTVC